MKHNSALREQSDLDQAIKEETYLMTLEQTAKQDLPKARSLILQQHARQIGPTCDASGRRTPMKSLISRFMMVVA